MKNPGFEIKSPCGRVWFVSHAAVMADYIEYVKQADGLTKAEATAYAKDNCDVECWFAEQFDWSDVKRLGTLVKEASADDIERALNFLQNNSGSSPAEDFEEKEAPLSTK